MLRPLIVIGCGGAGVNTLRYLRKSAKEALAKAGWDGPFPQAWQFIGVDVVAQSPSDPFGTEPIPVTDFISIGSGISYQNIQSVMETKHRSGGPGCIEMLGWKPTWAEINSPIAESLGQWRSVGRIAGLAVLMPHFGRRLTQAYRAIKSGTEEFRQMTELLTQSENWSNLEPLVIVVGSMAGGAGSAIMFDINEVVQRVNAANPGVFNVVYSADVFDSNVGSTNPGIHANSLAFMSELLSFSWNGGKSSDLIEDGIKNDYVAPPLTFMIESSNLHGRKMSNSSKESFEQIASWLTGVAISPAEQDRLTGTYERRYQHSLRTSGGYGFEKSSVQAPPGAIYSLGHAKLTVGRDRFPEYASKLLQRNTVDFLLNGEGEASKSQFSNESTETSAVTFKKKAENILQSFLVGANMSVSSELEEHFIDSVFNSIGTKSVSELVKLELEKELKAAIESGVDLEAGLIIGIQRVKDHNLQRFVDLISKEVRELKNRVLNGISDEMSRSFQTSSIPVVNEVLRMVQQLTDQVASQTRIKAADQIRKSKLERSQAMDVLNQNQNKRRVFRVGREADDSYLDFAVNSIYLEIRSQGLDYLSVALEELVKDDLARITHQLGDAAAILQSRLEEMVNWPKIDQEVPQWLRPRQFEFCLEDSESWPDSLRSLIGESQNPAADEDMHLMQTVRASIFMGGYESHDGELRGPLFDVFVNDVQVIDAQSVEDRVEDWLRRKGSGFVAFVEEGLQSYLADFSRTNGKIVDHEHRLMRYSKVLKDVIDACQPLVQIDENLSKEVYQNADVFAYPHFQLPHLGNAGADILVQLSSRYYPDQRDAFYPYGGGDANSSSFRFTSLLNNPLNPSVFKRFTESQYKLVRSRMDTANQWQFVPRWRRTRKLSEYIPLPTELRHAAIRGFAVGRILGYITVDTNEAIKISGMDREYTFPRRLLTHSGPKNLLPALLESMSLCFADVPILGQEAFGAYRELISLGVGSDGLPNSFEFENECLKYITTGSRLRIPVDTKRVEMMSAETPSERQYKMVAYLNDNISRYEEVLASVEAAPDLNLFSADDKLTIELIEDLLPSYQMVIDSVRRYVDETCIDYF
jgi:hypothetical protein